MTYQLDQLVEFANSKPTTVMLWLPEADYYTDPTPIYAVQANGNMLGWWPAFQSQPTGDVVRKVMPDNGGWRADLASDVPTSAFFRPQVADENPRLKAWLESVRDQDLDTRVHNYLNSLAAFHTERPSRRKLFLMSFWFQRDFRVNREVPAGIVLASEDNHWVEWVPLPGWEDSAFSRNRVTGPVDDAGAVLVDLAERPGQNHSISYPEYIRAADRDDAVLLGINRQWAALAQMLGAPPQGV